MNFMEAIKLMKDGKKIRRPIFRKDNYLYFENHILMSGISKERAYLCEGHFEATDWEEVKEQKSNIKNKLEKSLNELRNLSKQQKEVIDRILSEKY